MALKQGNTATKNGRRLGSIQKRGTGRYLVRLFNGYDGEGKREYKNKTIIGTRKEAEDALADLRVEAQAGNLPGRAAEASRMNDLFALVLRDYKINDKDYRWAEGVIRVRLAPHFGKLKASKVTSDTIDQYVERRKEEGQPNATINRALALIRRSFNLGKRHKPPLVASPPIMTMLAENNVRTGFFEDSEYRALIKALPGEVQPVVSFAYYTGCRRAEILSLKWSQVDLIDGVVRLDPGTTKSGEGRMIPLFGELLELLRLLKEGEAASEFVFHRGGAPIKYFRRTWLTACKAAGLWKDGRPTRLLHDLRRTGVRNLVRAGVPEKVAMSISGHKTRSVFERYNIVDEADLKQAMQKVDRYIAEKRAKESESSHTTRTLKTSKAIH